MIRKKKQEFLLEDRQGMKNKCRKMKIEFKELQMNENSYRIVLLGKKCGRLFERLVFYMKKRK